MLERVEAFRDLIRHGNTLLGEVVSYCRAAESAVAQIAAEKEELDRLRAELGSARERADSEAEVARQAMVQLESQRAELATMRSELLQARNEVGDFQKIQAGNAEVLERSLADARHQQQRLQEELERVRAQAESTRTLDHRLGQVEQMETKLRVTERELSDTRRALEEERGRRDRAIALIRPKSVEARA